MPRLNTSKQVKARTRQFLERLLSYANYELPESDQFYDKLTVRWKNEDTDAPELVVETELKVLIELAFAQPETPRLKDQLRNDLRVLEEFLQILEDNRARTQGAKHWRFTLKLWGKSTESNLTAFESVWDERKRKRSKRGRSVVVPAMDDATPSADDLPDDGGLTDAGRSRPTGRSSDLQPSNPQTDPLGPDIVPGSPPAAPSAGGANLPVSPSDPDAPQLRTNLLLQQGADYKDSGYLAQLLELLSFDKPSHLITLEGQGGVGKTTLALEAARLCQLASEATDQHPTVPAFEAIIFTSAQTQHFNGPDLSPRLGHQRNLQDIFRTIFRTLDRLSSIPADFHDQLVYVRDCLSQQKTLLIVDNLETLEDKEYVLSFLREIPHTVKVLVTSRVRLGMGYTLSLQPLSKEEGIDLIQQQAKAQSIPLNQSQLEQLYALTGGLPLAIVYSLGLMSAFGISPSHLQPADLSAPTSDLARHCFNVTVERLKHQPAYNLLLAFACFRRPALPEALAHVAYASPHQRENRRPFNELYRLSLIESRQERYTMHSLTREYAMAELKANSGFEVEARDRWIEWYLEFLSVHGEENWYDWHPTSPIDAEWENIREVVDWCREVNAYNDFIDLWQHLKGYTQIYGHWNERLVWMQWLVDEAERRQQAQTMADAMYHYSRTLFFFDQSHLRRKAIEVAHRVWEIAEPTNWQLLVDTAILLATLSARAEKHDDALAWIVRGEDVLEKQAITKEKISSHQWVNVPYYKAEIHSQTNNFTAARRFYKEALQRAEAVGIKKATAYIKGALGVINIEEGALEEAERLLKSLLTLVKQENDKRCLAFCYQHLARIEKARGNMQLLNDYTKSAQAIFNALNMREQSLDVGKLLDRQQVE
ncbi:MAG: NB-ARC domain-containing protein [Cyanobacteria bacterium J06648_16]